MESLKTLSASTTLPLDKLQSRHGASSGIWMIGLLPLACSPGFYTAYLHCSAAPCLLPLLALQVGVSGIYLYHPVYSKAFTPKVKHGVSLQPSPACSFFRQLITHPYLPALITAGAIAIQTEAGFFLALLNSIFCQWVLYGVTRWLFLTFPGNFSLGEGALIGQAGALSLTMCIYHLGYICLVPHGRLTENQEISVFIQIAEVIISVLLYGIYRFPALCKPHIFVPTILLFGIIGVCISSLLLQTPAIFWLIEVMTHSSIRILLLAWWGGLAILGIASTSWGQRQRNFPTTVLRKLYHLVIVLVFLPGILLEPSFTLLASTAALMFCCLLEVFRVQKIEPISSLVTEAFSVFLDEKDAGPLVLSHIYLLVGVAAPLWLTPCSLGALPPLPLMSGVLAVGIGDTAASIGGTYFGNKKWPGTKKTFIGSLCGFTAQVMVVCLLVALGFINMNFTGWCRLIIASLIVSIVEAFTDQVDNIVLPLIFFTQLMDP